MGDTSQVGNYPTGASPYGALDMSGNVWEWVNDWYGRDYYSDSPYSNPQGPPSGTYKVLRGGSWYDWLVRRPRRVRVPLPRPGRRCSASSAFGVRFRRESEVLAQM